MTANVEVSAGRNRKRVPLYDVAGHIIRRITSRYPPYKNALYRVKSG